MQMMPRLILPALLVLATVAAPLSAQTGTVRGRVADSAGTPLTGASVIVEGTGLRTTSGSGGAYEVRGVPAGTRTLRARLIGYAAATTEINVPEAGAAEHDFTLL